MQPFNYNIMLQYFRPTTLYRTLRCYLHVTEAILHILWTYLAGSSLLILFRSSSQLIAFQRSTPKGRRTLADFLSADKKSSLVG